MVKGCVYSTSIHQKLNIMIATESEIVVVDDVIAMVLWSRYFLESQGYKVDEYDVF